MCEEPRPSGDAVARVAPRPVGESEVEPVALEPVDRVRLTTLVDNVSDMLLVDQRPAKRFGVLSLAGMPRIPEPLFEQGETVEGLHAEHGFSMLVTVERGDRRTHIVFDTGMTPDGMIGNMRRLGVDAGDVEVMVLSHGHFDHTTGLEGFVRAVGRPNIPVVIHPGLWTRRRLTIPGVDPIEIPTMSQQVALTAIVANRCVSANRTTSWASWRHKSSSPRTAASHARTGSQRHIAVGWPRSRASRSPSVALTAAAANRPATASVSERLANAQGRVVAYRSRCLRGSGVLPCRRTRVVSRVGGRTRRDR
jgi:hypothetical protein